MIQCPHTFYHSYSYIKSKLSSCMGWHCVFPEHRGYVYYIIHSRSKCMNTKHKKSYENTRGYLDRRPIFLQYKWMGSQLDTAGDMPLSPCALIGSWSLVVIIPMGPSKDIVIRNERLEAYYIISVNSCHLRDKIAIDVMLETVRML